jgi:DNA-binding winged helix-turn-helix (wHTH) protein/predicted ATPase
MNRPQGPGVSLSLDRANECVNRGEHALRLTPKAFAVLRHLVERPGRLATKDELLTAVWPDTSVTDASLSTCIREIRRALDDNPAKPLYIQTVHRRGYRYVGATLDATLPPATSRAIPPRDALLVGRDGELASLDRSLEQVEAGERRLIFLPGEAGIGKTALVERFVARTAGRATAQIARGQCVEQYGACEPYLPWFDVLNQLSRDYGRERLAAVLRRCAPMWLAQLPWLIDASERHHLQREIAGATRERMIRELAEVLEALGSDSPVIVILEDLHWSDPSSIGLLAYLARRPRPGRLLLLGTYRPSELHVTSHPLIALKQELLLHGACEDLSLGFLTTEAVGEYVRSRLPGAPDDLARQVHRRTDGNPLFMVNVIDYLLARGALVHADGGWRLTETAKAATTEVPESLKEMIERQLDRLSHDDRLVLEAASVAGAAFSAASVAAVLEESVESAEERLGGLARRGSFVRPTDRQTWPDGTQSDGYAFIHVLYQNVLYERMGAARRSRMHRHAGYRLEAGYRDRARQIAAELALHFQRGRDSQRAVRYLAQAGENAIQRGAYVEAIALLTQGLDLLSTLPEEADRDACELQLRVPLGLCYVNTRGYAAPEVGITFERAHELCRHATDTSHLFRVLRGLWFFALQRSDLRKARSIAEELLHVAAREQDPSGVVEGHRVMATTWFHLGNFASALDHLQRGLALYDAERHSPRAFLYGQDPGVCCHAWHGWTQWYRGYPDQALMSAIRGIELARQIGHPFSLSYAMNFAARVCVCRGEATAAEGYAAEGVRYAREQGLTPMLAMGQVLHGWSRTFLGDSDAAVGELQEGVARWRSTGARLATPYWMYLLASALDRAGRSAEALDTLNEALAQLEHTDERWVECELYILKASLTARASRKNGRRGQRTEAQRHLRRAFHAATEIDSPSLRLRAATALGRLLREHGHTHEAQDLVGTAYAAFSEGFQTADLAEARAMLAQR